jgi:hypothetical protein
MLIKAWCCCILYRHTTPTYVRGHPFISLPPLSSPSLPLFICVSPTPLYYLQGPHPKPMTFVFKVQWLSRSRLTVIDFPLLPPLVPQQHQMSLRCIGTHPRDTMTPSTVMWMAINGRLGTRRLGTVILSISFVVWPSQGFPVFSVDLP